ncbi:MAG TPA: RNA polymerase sigma factor [Gaiellaceae bacterium]|nr:RNA polymerase sigma factor [Gaiellaceae bacterium]
MQDFERIYAEHVDAVRAYVRRRAHPDMVEDVVADTFVVALRKPDSLPRDLLPWLYAVARKTLANARRKEERTLPLVPEVAREPEPAGDARLAAAFAALGERDREVLRLVAWEGLALRDAATVLDCSPVACRVRYHRAKSRLAALLEAPASFRPEPKGVMR